MNWFYFVALQSDSCVCVLMRYAKVCAPILKIVDARKI